MVRFLNAISSSWISNRLTNLSDDPAKKLISIKLQMQAADREGYRHKPLLATKYFVNALELLDSLPNDYDQEIQKELKTGVLKRLAEKCLAINDYQAAAKYATDYLSQKTNNDAQVKTILAVSFAMMGNVKKARSLSQRIDWSDNSVSVLSGRKLLIELITDCLTGGLRTNQVFQQFKNKYTENLDRGDGNQFFKEDLCRSIDWLVKNGPGSEGSAKFIAWSKATVIQILIDESIPRFSDGARSLTQDVRLDCVRGVAEFDNLVNELNSH